MISIWPGKHWLENDCTEFLGFLEQIRSSCLSAPWNDKTHKSELLRFVRVVYSASNTRKHVSFCLIKRGILGEMRYSTSGIYFFLIIVYYKFAVAQWFDPCFAYQRISVFIRVWSRRCLYECVWLDEWGMLYKVLVTFRYSKKDPCENRPSLETAQSVADSHTWRVVQCGMGKSVAGFGTALRIWWTDL